MTRNAFVFALAFAALPATLRAQSDDSTHAGRYDLGKMWTFENAPADYFSSTYGFTADSAWFARARLSALRIPGCSAGLVSPNGLIVTNHHCVRGRVPSVGRPGETLLDSGFTAHSLAEERRIPGYYADQLLAALDVTAEVDAATASARSDEAREAARRATGAAIADRLHGQYAAPGDSVWVQMVPLYNGARTSAYVFRRLLDIRLVAAVELGMGFFGGDPDNFTFPRYALDFAVLRAYGADGRPLSTPTHFGWSRDGVQVGDVVFVIGNPGQTSRLTTMAQLEYMRDVSVPVQLGYLRSRLDAMRDYRTENMEEAEALDIRNRMFGLSNSEKSLGGRLEALADPTIMARRADNERVLRDSLRAHADLQRSYGALFDRLTSVQRDKRRYATPYRAFAMMLSGGSGSGTLIRAYWTWRALHSTPDSVALFQRQIARAPTWPRALEVRFLTLQLADIARAYGSSHAITRAALGATTPDAAANRLLASSALAAGGGDDPASLANDPAVRMMDAFAPAWLAASRELSALQEREGAAAADIGRARYAIFGASVPPDGSFSPRIADGVVQGYRYNGTLAPAWTTFYGIYDRWRSFGAGTDWELPHRWRTPPAGLDLGTPLNFVSTADSYGGNSGSPAVTRDLRLVGLNFDRNINALVRDYLYLPERGRNVMVDARAITAALDTAYDMDRIVKELLTGRLYATEAEADAGP